MLWQNGAVMDTIENPTVCMHHEPIFLTKYELLQMKCCEPLKWHSKTVKTGPVSSGQATQIGIKPGQKLCTSCRLMMFSSQPDDTAGSVKLHSSSEDSEPDIIFEESLSSSLTGAGCSPLKMQKVSRRDAVPYLK